MPTPQKAISNATEFTAIHTRATGAVAAKYLISRQPVAPDIIGGQAAGGSAGRNDDRGARCRGDPYLEQDKNRERKNVREGPEDPGYDGLLLVFGG